METFGNGSSLSKKKKRNNHGQRLDKIIANRVQSRPIRFHSYWLKMKMMEWSVNASLLRHSNDVGGPACPEFQGAADFLEPASRFPEEPRLLMGPPERRSQRVRTLGMRSQRFSGPARSENIGQNYGPAAFFGVPSAFPSRRLNGINVDIFRLRFRGEKK